MVNASEAELRDTALAAVRDHMGITAAPDCVVAGVNAGAIPQPTVGHFNRVAAVRAGARAVFGNRLLITGNSFDGVAAVDCVAAGRQCATNLTL